jgi:serine/threonine-protein kinase
MATTGATAAVDPTTASTPRLVAVAPAHPAVMAAAPEPLPTAATATTARHAVPRRLAPTTVPQRLADRILRFAPAADGVVDMATRGQRLRVTLMPEINGHRSVHLKGLSCFVARRGGRPTAAVLLDHEGDFDLVSPRSQIIGSGRLSRGAPAAGHTVFTVEAEAIALAVDDCADPLLIDFGPGAECHIIYAVRRGDRGRRSTRRSDPP